MSSTPQHPYGTGDDPDRSSGTTPPPYGSTPPSSSGGAGFPGATPSDYGTGSSTYGSTPPPAYGSPASSSYGAPPAYTGGDYGQGPSPYGYAYPKNSLGVWSFVLGLIGLVLSCGLFTGIPAIVIGHKARGAVAEGQANNPGMATAGIVMGWIATILSVLGLIAVVVLIATGALAEYISTTSTSTPSF